MTDDKPRQRRNRLPANTTSRLSDDQLTAMSELFPGFKEWYVRTHDENGKMLPSAQIPGLTPRHYGEENEE